MLSHPTMTQSQVADIHSISPTQLSQILRLSKLSEDAKKLVDTDKIKPTAALVLVTIPTEFQGQFLEQAMTMPTNEFIEYVKSNRDKIKKAQVSGSETVETNEFPPELMSKAEIVIKLKTEKELLEASDVGNVEEYSRLTGRVQAFEEVLSLDPPTLTYRKGEKERVKRASEEKRALKKMEEAQAALAELNKNKEATTQKPSVTQGV